MQPLKTRGVTSLAILLLLSCFLSCRTNNPLTYEIKPLEGKVIFSIKEGYPSPQTVSSPRIMLSMRTEKGYPCLNYSIATEVSRTANKIDVRISGIIVPKICICALGAARYQTSLDLTDGTYSLVISNQQYDDRYEVKVSGSSVETIEKESHFTIPEQKT